MKSTAKASALMRDMADKLSVRLKYSHSNIDTVRPAIDANGWPMLFMSVAANEAEGAAVVAMRITAVNAVSKDVFGNDLIAFAPHILEVAYELGAAPGNFIPAHSDVFTVLWEAIRTGCHLQVKEVAAGTAVTEAAMNAATVITDLEELYWPTKGV